MAGALVLMQTVVRIFIRVIVRVRAIRLPRGVILTWNRSKRTISSEKFSAFLLPQSTDNV